jgi:pimeloyl-ACP methyl ester carboxylesterase
VGGRVLLPEPAGTGRYSAGLFYDYQNNVKSYPKWQQWLRDIKPPLLVLWGRYDTSFTVAGGEAYKKDDPRAEVHILDAGHFALDLKPKEIIRLTKDFMARQDRSRRSCASTNQSLDSPPRFDVIAY